MNINPGELNKRIQIIEKSSVPETDGFSDSVSEKVIREPWASFKRTTGKEKIQAGTEMDVVKARFIVRASQHPLNTDMIIRYDGNVYDIEYINNYSDSDEYVEIWTQMVV